MTRTLSREHQLVALLGHELRNPLAAAMTSLAVVRELTDAADPRAAYLEMAQRDLGRLSTLLERCLEFARAGKPARAELDLHELAQGVAARRVAGRVTVAAESERLQVLGDRALLERVLENLVDNALANGAAQVEVWLAHEDGAAVLHVADDGPGVPERLRDSIFEPLVSGRGSNGLGLWLVREIVRAHGGEIGLVPTTKGALFRLTLPS